MKNAHSRPDEAGCSTRYDSYSLAIPWRVDHLGLRSRMKPKSSRLGTLLLDRIAQEGLAGDLNEELHGGRSRAWYWRQVIGQANVQHTRGALTQPFREDLGRAAIGATEPAALQQSRASLRAGRRARPLAGGCVPGTAETPNRRLFRAKFARRQVKACGAATVWAGRTGYRHEDQTIQTAKSHTTRRAAQLGSSLVRWTSVGND
jgi:hypothetical protein